MFKKTICMIMTLVLLSSSTAFAGGGSGPGIATEVTQLENNVELATQVGQLSEQISNQIKMIQDLIYNTTELPQQMFGNVTQIYSQIKGVMNRTRGLAYTMSNLDEEMKMRFKSYSNMSGMETTQDFQNEYRKITDTQMETARTTLESLGVSWKQLENDDTEALIQLQNVAKSAKGRNQIMQSTNQFLSFLAEESLKLRQLVMTQTQMMTVAIEADRAEKDAAERYRDLATSGIIRDPFEGQGIKFRRSVFDALEGKYDEKD